MSEFETKVVQLLGRIVEQLEAIATELRQLREPIHGQTSGPEEAASPIEDVRHTGP
jgi:hypothetical protein